MKFTILLPQLIYAFGFTTHRYLGGLLERTLDPNTVSRIKKITNETDLSELSTWADRVKYTHEYYWTKPLHYLDIPVCNKFDLTETDIEKICKNRCIYSAINNFTANMNDPDNIKFLIHFLQDLHQPMHLLGIDRGGNGDQLIVSHRGRNKTTNLHQLWDTIIPEWFVKTANYKPKNVESNSLIQIINRVHQIACEKYPGNNHFLIFEDYYNPDLIRELFDSYLSFSMSILQSNLKK